MPFSKGRRTVRAQEGINKKNASHDLSIVKRLGED